ncbi:hypothetical protein SAMN05444359_101129 [Neolewinella agarilytica]|uniref:Uncharacterized protein n=1 Tax=Neolewinella agarilytica TaxID=478744 RepID=A0A1H8Z1G4_9BACT|nr:hypothetical protein SAMN05444359_101129 [Neolewinella agarilytica]
MCNTKWKEPNKTEDNFSVTPITKRDLDTLRDLQLFLPNRLQVIPFGPFR